MPNHEWDLKTQPQEAAIQTSIEALNAHFEGMKEELLAAVTANKDDDIKQQQAIDKVFLKAEEIIADTMRMMINKFDYANRYIVRTQHSDNVHKFNLELAITLTNLAGVMNSLAAHYFVLLATAAGKEDSTLTCTTMTEQQAKEYTGEADETIALVALPVLPSTKGKLN